MTRPQPVGFIRKGKSDLSTNNTIKQLGQHGLVLSRLIDLALLAHYEKKLLIVVFFASFHNNNRLKSLRKDNWYFLNVFLSIDKCFSPPPGLFHINGVLLSGWLLLRPFLWWMGNSLLLPGHEVCWIYTGDHRIPLDIKPTTVLINPW